MNCVEQAKRIYSICVESASTAVLTYQDALARIGYGPGVSGQAIRYGLELAWIACASLDLPILTTIIVNKQSGQPTASGYPLGNWSEEVQAVFDFQGWPEVDSIDWNYVW